MGEISFPPVPAQPEDDGAVSRRRAGWALGLAFVPFIGGAVGSVTLAALVLTGPRDAVPRGRGRAWAALGVNAAVLVLVGALLITDDPELVTVQSMPQPRPASTEVPAGPVTQGEVFVEDLAVGDCVDEDFDAIDAVLTLTVTRCDGSHRGQVFLVQDLPDGEFPGDAAVEDQSYAMCDPGFEAWIGRPYASSSLSYVYYFPDAERWATDRTVQCIVTTPSPVTGTLQGSGR